MTYTYRLSRRLAAIHEVAPTLRPLVLLLLILLATACGTGELTNPETPSRPLPNQAVPGWLSLLYSTPNADDGAVQIRISGPAMDSLTLTGGRGLAAVVEGAGRVLVAGDVQSGVIARMWVPDIRKSELYLTLVEQVAARGSYRLRDVTLGYGVQVIR